MACSHQHATYTPTNIKVKIGNFSFTVTDFSLQVAGLAVQLNRSYSSLQKKQSSDFGYGWSLEYKNVTLQENILLGEEGRTTSDTFGIGYCFEFKTDHIVHINMPDGRVRNTSEVVDTSGNEIEKSKNSASCLMLFNKQKLSFL